MRKYFAPLNGEIKPDTDQVRTLLKAGGWLRSVDERKAHQWCFSLAYYIHSFWTSTARTYRLWHTVRNIIIYDFGLLNATWVAKQFCHSATVYMPWHMGIRAARSSWRLAWRQDMESAADLMPSGRSLESRSVSTWFPCTWNCLYVFIYLLDYSLWLSHPLSFCSA